MPRKEQITLEAGGYEVTNWTQYNVDSDLRTPADGFSLALAAGGSGKRDLIEQRNIFRDLVADGTEVRLYVESEGRKTLQLTGAIDTRDVSADRDGGFQVSVSGRDNAAALVDSSVSLAIGRRDVLFVSLVADAVEPWGIEVVTDPEASRSILTGMTRRQQRNAAATRAQALAAPAAASVVEAAQKAGRSVTTAELLATVVDPALRKRYANALSPSDVERIRVSEARPQAGETVWEYLARHAKRLGLMMWMSPDGKLVVGSPTYTNPPLYSIVRRFTNRPADPNNVLSGTRRTNSGDRYSRVTVHGRQRGGDAFRARIRHTETDDSMRVLKPLIVHDQNVRSAEDAERVAKRFLSEGRQFADVLEYTVAGHAQNGAVYAIDTIARVVDEVTGVDGDYYVTRRTLRRDRQGGTMTDLTLVPRGSLVL